MVEKSKKVGVTWKFIVREILANPFALIINKNSQRGANERTQTINGFGRHAFA